DRTEHVWAGAARMAETQVAKVVFDRPGERIERPVHDLEFARGRALEREDRLLLVADGENRAPDEARAGAREEFAREPPDDVPLLRAGVLRFVDQHVVDALIELVVHPGRPLLAQQRQGLVDQVVVIEISAPVFRRLVAGDHGIGDGDERRGAVAAGPGVAGLAQREDGLAFAAELFREPGIVDLDRAGDQLLARLELAGEEYLQIHASALRAGGCERVGEAACLLLIALGPAREDFGGRRPLRRRKQRGPRALRGGAFHRFGAADPDGPDAPR